MSDEGVPQFGIPVPGQEYRERPGAYAVILDADRVLVVATPSGLYLPGGGLADGETAEQALERELVEETGCRPAVVTELGRARQYVGAGINKVERFFVVALNGAVAGGSEHDHCPRWASADEAVAGLAEDAQRWALLRALAAPPFATDQDPGSRNRPDRWSTGAAKRPCDPGDGGAGLW